MYSMNKLGRCNLIQSDLEVSRRRGEREGGIKQRYPTLFVKYLEKCKVTTPVASVAMQSVEWFEFRELQFNFETFPLLWNQYLVCGIDFSCVNCRISLINLWYTVSIVNSSSFFLFFFFFLSLFLSLHLSIELQIMDEMYGKFYETFG